MSQLKRKQPNTFKQPVDFRDQASFTFAKEIVKPFGAIESVLDWAKQEFIGEWRWQLVEVSSERRPGRYIFYFESERDYLAFLLKCS
jgi:hypothetical protein